MKKTILIIIGIIIVAATVIFVVRNNKLLESKNTIKVGALLILSGDFAKYGEASKNAIEIAVFDYNSRPSVTSGKDLKVEVIYEDTHADPKTAVSAYQKLVSFDKVDVIVGPLLQVEMSAIESLVKKEGIPVFSVAPIPIEQRGNTSNPLVIWPDPTLEAEQMAQYVFDQGIKTIGSLSTRDAWESEVSEAFSKKFTSLGGQIVANEVVLPDSNDTSLPVTKVIAAKPEAIFVGTYYKFIYFVKKIKELGFKGKLYSIEIDTYLSGETKPYSDGLQFISPAFYTPKFTKEYQDRYGEAPSIPSGQAHDAMSLLLSLITKADSTNFKDDMLNEMAKLTEFDGVSGKITFASNHRATFPLSIFQIDNGAINKIK